METPCRNRAGHAPILAALASIVCFALPASAQIAGGKPPGDAAAPGSGSEADPGQGRISELFVATHDVTGKLGTPLPLEVRLIRVGAISIEAIHLLGLPRGVTISDSTNTFSPSDDKRDVDISAWDLPNIQITQTDERESSFPLAVAAIWTPEPGGQVDVATSLLNVNFLPNTPDHPATVRGDERRGPETPTAPPRGAPSAAPIVANTAAPDASVATQGGGAPLARGTPAGNTPVNARPASPAVVEARPAAGDEAGRAARPVGNAQPAPLADPLVERASGLIRLGDISGARLLLERAQARNAPNATFLLAQTWDPAMLRRWNVRGLRADPDLARSLYAKAAGQNQTDERLLAATGR
jgi:hypothetical protein